MIVPGLYINMILVWRWCVKPCLSDWGQGELERQLWRAAVQLQLLLLCLALLRVDGAAVLRH